MLLSLNNHLIVLAPSAPPKVCGVSDYAWQIAGVLNKYYETVKIGVHEMPSAAAHNSATITVNKFQKVLVQARILRQSYDILINYTPTAFGRAGWPAGLISALKNLKEEQPNTKVFVFFHETWDGGANLKLHHAMRDKLVKHAIISISNLADGIMVVTNDQKQRISSLIGDKEIRVGRVGANILPHKSDEGLQTERQAGKWVIFGLPHTRLWTLKAHMPMLINLHQKGLLKKLTTIGPADNKFAHEEADLIKDTFGEEVLEQLGALEPLWVSDQLLKTGAALIAQTTDSLNKSGSFAALAAHAVPVVYGAVAQPGKPLSEAMFSTDEINQNPLIIFGGEGRKRAANLHAWFSITRSWDVIGLELAHWMKGTSQLNN